MAKKETTYKGFTIDEIKKMSIKEFSDIAPSRVRRTIKRGFTDAQKAFLARFEKSKKELKTHCRDMIILPNMVNKTIKVYSGKEFVPVLIQPEMVGHYLGEFVMTRRRVGHNAPGIGATKSSAAVSVK